MNTTKKSRVRYIIFKERGTWYGVALEFNIVEEADDADVVQFNLQEAVRGYVASQKKIKGSRFAPLNQKADPEYEKMWKQAYYGKPIPSPVQVSNVGYSLV